jgi:diguanylate cyclase (GGDEF)-like protein
LAAEFGMNTSKEASLQARVALLGELNSAELDVGRLAKMLADWVQESLGLAAEVELAESSEPLASHSDLEESPSRIVRFAAGLAVPEVADSHWRFPLVHRGRTLGTLNVQPPKENAEAVCPTVVRDLAAEFARLLDQARRFEEAREQALRDELTGLGNRRMFERALRKHIEAAREQRFPFSVLLFDVDHFKRFNDTWGHETGDRVLGQVAELMKRVFRTEDVVCRIGGEEFAVLLCDQRSHGPDSAPPREARIFVERLQREAERLSEESNESGLLAKISLSGGVATFPWDAQSPEDLLREADNALYAAKRAGRNRIYFAGDDADLIATLAG